MPVQDLIKAKRLELDLTMKQVADYVGVSEATVSRWESGDIANMRRDKIYSLSKILHLSPLDILGWEEKEQPAVIGELSQNEKALLAAFAALSPAQQEAVLVQLRALAQLEADRAKPEESE